MATKPSREVLEYLEALQRSLQAASGGARDFALDGPATRAIDELVKARTTGSRDPDEVRDQIKAALVESLAIELPTRFENPYFYALLQSDLRAIDGHARDEMKIVGGRGRVQFDSLPLFGTLPTGELDAFTAKVPESSEFVVVVNESLFVLLNLASKVVAQAMPESMLEGGGIALPFSSKEVVERIAGSAPEVRLRFVDVLDATVRRGNPSAAAVYAIPEPWAHTAAELRQAAELFAVAHEYAHILLGHLELPCRKAALGTSGADGDVVDIDLVVRSWQQEYDADCLGALIGNSTAVRRFGLDGGRSWGAIEMYFAIVEVVHRAVSTLDHGQETVIVQSTHPPPALRRRMIREHIGLAFSAPEAISYVNGLGEALVWIVETIWLAIKDVILAAHRRGERSASCWHTLLNRRASVNATPSPRLTPEQRAGMLTFLSGMVLLEGEERIKAAAVCLEAAGPIALSVVEELAQGDDHSARRLSVMVSRLSSGAAKALPAVRNALTAFGRYVPLNQFGPDVLAFLELTESSVKNYALQLLAGK